MIKVSATSHVGNRYTVNEDKLGWDESIGLYFIADGMGGHAGGAVASELVSKVLLSQSAPISLKDCVMQAHKKVCSTASSGAGLAGMGSTVVATHIQDDQCEICWVGDSRAYLWRAGKLERLTEDHSLVQMMLNNGELTQEQARHHKYRHVISQTLGVATPEPDRCSLSLLPNDCLLLCSDGLTDELSDSEISNLLNNARNSASADSKLVEAALSKIGRDNISVMILKYQDHSWRAQLWKVSVVIGLIALGLWFWS